MAEHFIHTLRQISQISQIKINDEWCLLENLCTSVICGEKRSNNQSTQDFGLKILLGRVRWR
jgi:hypothetical protein